MFGTFRHTRNYVLHSQRNREALTAPDVSILGAFMGAPPHLRYVGPFYPTSLWDYRHRPSAIATMP